MNIEVNRNRKLFGLGCLVFFGLSFFISYWLLVGAIVGGLGMYLCFPVLGKLSLDGKRIKLDKMRREVLKLESELK